MERGKEGVSFRFNLSERPDGSTSCSGSRHMPPERGTPIRKGISSLEKERDFQRQTCKVTRLAATLGHFEDPDKIILCADGS